MSHHISHVCKSAFYQLRQLKKLTRSLKSHCTAQLVHAQVTSRLDYCNSLFAGLPAVLLHPLQSVLNATARLVSGCSRPAHITPVLKELHWLPVAQHIRYKVCLLVCKCLHGLAPPYLGCLFKPVPDVAGRSALCSSSHGDLIVPVSARSQ